MISQTARPLIEVLAEIEDARQARGKRHPLVAILALVCVATLCGYRSYGAMAEWGRNYGADLLAALGFTRPTAPSAATLYRALRGIDRAAFEAAIGAWAEEVLGTLGSAPDDAAAIDGKALRGSRKQGAADAHLLAAVSQRLGLPLGQEGVDEKTNEIPVLHDLLRGLVVEGRVYTMDALLTQRAAARASVDGGGDYVMVAKDNQPRLRDDAAALLASPLQVGLPLTTASTVDLGHGRVERRRVTVRALLPGDCDWPGARQVFMIERHTTHKKSGRERHEVTYGVTSRSPEHMSARELLRLLRGHWHSEHGVHWVRDVTFDEDRSQVRTGAIPEVLAAVRTTAIALFRHAGEANIAAACRRCAAQPARALALIGLASTMK